MPRRPAMLPQSEMLGKAPGSVGGEVRFAFRVLSAGKGAATPSGKIQAGGWSNLGALGPMRRISVTWNQLAPYQPGRPH